MFHSRLLPISYWLVLNHMAIFSSKRSWEIVIYSEYPCTQLKSQGSVTDERLIWCVDYQRSLPHPNRLFCPLLLSQVCCTQWPQWSFKNIDMIMSFPCLKPSGASRYPQFKYQIPHGLCSNSVPTCLHCSAISSLLHVRPSLSPAFCSSKVLGSFHFKACSLAVSSV